MKRSQAFFSSLFACAIAVQSGHPVHGNDLTNYSQFKTFKCLQTDVGVSAVDFSRDSARVAAGTTEGVYVWDTASGSLLRAFIARSAPVTSIAFSPNAQQVATGTSGAGAGVKLWDIKSGKLLRVFPNEAPVKSVAFTQDGKMLASAGDDGSLFLWNARSGKLVRALTGNSHPITAIRFSEDGKTLTTAGGGLAGKCTELTDANGNATEWLCETESEVIWWNTSTGEPEKRYTVEGGGPNVCLSPDGTKLSIVGSGAICGSKPANLVDGNIGRPIPHFVRAVAASNEAPTPAPAWLASKVKIWQLPQGDETSGRYLPASIEARGRFINKGVASTAWSPDGKAVAMANAAVLKFWDGGDKPESVFDYTRSATDGSKVEVAELAVVAFSPNGKIIAGGCANKGVQIWRAP